MSETRQRTAGVFVRFTPAQLEVLQSEARVQGCSVPELLRDRSLGRNYNRAAS
ncbi:plasmid mobilization protein [Mycolicibacterium tokaiense]|jgi:hypothetical protein|uniref:CopG family transcriptional regulator n=1 Tax=Mycolicibacterium tokaiense TaxID=39695 RepID=A0A379PKY8_9MYCO|nr:hypothetical protein [Mycolicibacterium tokaiense]SUE94932.1 Uncharacterised protein [Mycolicibacterium tokaiense]